MSMMKKGKRFYINITNRCNTNCPFCCMYSSTENNLDMDFSIYREIIDSAAREFELQLEGGEPLLHPSLYSFMEYAASTGRCRKILILSNGILLEKHLLRLHEFSLLHRIPTEIKVSVNYWLIEAHRKHLDLVEGIIAAAESLPLLDIYCNVRLRHEDGALREEIEKRPLLAERSNIYYLQSYGRLEDDSYQKPVIVQNIEDWAIYSTDGRCFFQDLEARSRHEKELAEENALLPHVSREDRAHD